MLCRDNAYRQVLLLLQCCLLLPKPISELTDPFVHRSHLQVALVQALSLLLQLWVLILVELVPQLTTKKDNTKGWREDMVQHLCSFKNKLRGSVFFRCWISFCKSYFHTPVAPCRGGLVQLQSSGCHGSCPFCHFWATPVVGWAPPPWTQPLLVLSASAGTGCSSARSPPLERGEEEWVMERGNNR